MATTQKEENELEKPGDISRAIVESPSNASPSAAAEGPKDPTFSDETTQPKPEMEVHHHAHIHENTKWKEYVFQFFMLFLAVFCGFLAEYMLEHRIEGEREEAYINSMIEDLKSDTAQISRMIENRISHEKTIDSLINIMVSPSRDQHRNEMYLFAREISLGFTFFTNDRTIQQLKNSGGMRLIRKMRVSNAIMSYDLILRRANLAFSIEDALRNDYRQLARKLFKGDEFYKILKTVTARNEFVRPSTNPRLFTTDTALINEYVNQCQYMQNASRLHRMRITEAREAAAKLIDFLQSEYGLKE